MNPEAIIAGLNTVLRGVKGVSLTLDYVPETIQQTAVVFTILDSFTQSQSGQLLVTNYSFLSTLVVQWQDNRQAERELAKLVPRITAAIYADQQLGGALNSGIASVANGQRKYFVVDEKSVFLAFELTIAVLEKVPVTFSP